MESAMLNLRTRCFSEATVNAEEEPATVGPDAPYRSNVNMC